VDAEQDSERLLAQALRAQAAGAGEYHPDPATTALPPALRSTPAWASARRQLAAGWVLLIALVLGLLAGAAAGIVSTL
jgi:hypothetical protein